MVKTREEWKALCWKKVKTAERLVSQKEWEVAGECMGYALECALKAVTCKTLGIEAYPPLKMSRDETKSGAEIQGFKTHEFDSLIVLSGLSGRLTTDFELNQFTAQYAGSWENRRYDMDLSTVYDEKAVIELSQLLYDTSEGILNKFEKEELW